MTKEMALSQTQHKTGELEAQVGLKEAGTVGRPKQLT